MLDSKIPHFTVDGAHYKSDDGMRLTDCCACFSTYHGDTLCCKKCYREVEVGEGDGNQYQEETDPQVLSGQDREGATPELIGSSAEDKGGVTPIRDPKNMSHEELALFATRLQDILYLDADEQGEYWNPDKVWSPTTLDDIGNLMNHTDLRPDYIERVPDQEPDVDDEIDSHFEAQEAENDALTPLDPPENFQLGTD